MIESLQAGQRPLAAFATGWDSGFDERANLFVLVSQGEDHGSNFCRKSSVPKNCMRSSPGWSSTPGRVGEPAAEQFDGGPAAPLIPQGATRAGIPGSRRAVGGAAAL